MPQLASPTFTSPGIAYQAIVAGAPSEPLQDLAAQWAAPSPVAPPSFLAGTSSGAAMEEEGEAMSTADPLPIA